MENALENNENDAEIENNYLLNHITNNNASENHNNIDSFHFYKDTLNNI